MSKQQEKTIWATAEAVEAFNKDLTDETREAVFADGVKGLRDYIEDVVNPALDIENIELVDWDVAYRICRDWNEHELWRTATDKHVRDYMTYLVQLQHLSGEVIERKSSKSPLTASKIFWRLRQRNEFDGQQVILVISQPGKELLRHDFNAVPGTPDHVAMDSTLPAPFLPYKEDKHSNASRAGKVIFTANLKPEEDELVQKAMEKSGITNKRKLLIFLAEYYKEHA